MLHVFFDRQDSLTGISHGQPKTEMGITDGRRGGSDERHFLERKKFIKQSGKRGRAFLYASVFDKEKLRESMSRELARRLYDDSVKSMILNLIQRGCVSELGLAEISRVIEEKLDVG